MEVTMTSLIRLAAALALGLFTTAAFAAGGTGGGSSSSSATPSVQPSASASTQKKPKVAVSKRKKKAKSQAASTTTKAKKKKKQAKPVEPAATETVDLWAGKYGDLGPTYIAAVKLAESEKYEEALAAFKALDKPEDPRVLNWIGFSLRKSGKVAEAMPYYEKALRIAPEFTPAYEYIGEAYLQLKNVEKAKEQLATIEKLCGNQTCEEYVDLSAAIAKSAL
jgi:tetratricopeptide (TPR) repeat protein